MESTTAKYDNKIMKSSKRENTMRRSKDELGIAVMDERT